METLITILVVAVIVGVIVWNKRTAASAMTGVEFHVPASVSEVSAAIHSAFNVGAGAKFKSFLGGIRVAGGGDSFMFESKIGDSGRIRLARDEGGTRVTASTRELYVGTHPRSHSRGGDMWSTASALAHGIYKLLGITPGAAKMKRFQLSLDGKITKQLRKAQR